MMWRFIQIASVCLLLPGAFTKSLSAVEKPDLPDASLLMEEFYHTVEAAVNHLVVSRDMHKLVREKRQLNNNFGQGSFGGFGQGSNGLGGGAGNLFTQNGLTGDVLGGLSNVANLASLGTLGSGAASGAPPILQGVGQVNNMVKTVVELDRMKCASRLACEFMANRGLFNRTSALVPPTVFPSLNENAQGALNLSHPSTFRSILGVLQLMRFQEFGAYAPIEAALWGVAHRDTNRCREQFTKCPSTAEAFITELNSTPGGLQSMLTNSLQAIRNTLPDASPDTAPQTAASVAELGGLGSNFGQQTGAGLGSFGGLGGLGGNQQFLNPSGSQFGGNQQQFFNPTGAQFGGNQQFLNPSASQFGGNQQFLNPSGSQFAANQQFQNPSFGQFGANQQFLNPSSAQFGGNQQFLNPVNAQFGGNQQFLSPSGTQFGGLGSNFGGPGGLAGVNNFNPGSFGTGALSGASGLGGVNGLGGLGGLGGSPGINGVNGFGGLNGLGGINGGLGGLSGFGNPNGFGSVSGLNGGSQFAGQGFQQAGLGSFNGLSGNFRSGVDEEKNKLTVHKPKWKWD